MITDTCSTQNTQPASSTNEKRELRFFVAGIPKPGGSKRVFPIRKGGVLTGRFVVTDDAGQGNKDWRASVAHEAKEAIQGDPWQCLLDVSLTFVLPRPKAHFRTGKNASLLREDAPGWHGSKPDVTKLVRAVEDACTGILWADDSQICIQRAMKTYGERPGCILEVRRADA